MFIPIKAIHLPSGQVNKIPFDPAIYIDSECIDVFVLEEEPNFAVGRTFLQRELLSVTDDGDENWVNVKAHYIIERFKTKEQAVHFSIVIAACGDCAVKVFDPFCYNRETGEYEDRNFDTRRHIKLTLEKHLNSAKKKQSQLETENVGLRQQVETAEAEAKRWRAKSVELAGKLAENESELRKYTQPIGE